MELHVLENAENNFLQYISVRLMYPYSEYVVTHVHRRIYISIGWMLQVINV